MVILNFYRTFRGEHTSAESCIITLLIVIVAAILLNIFVTMDK